jgi:hypothetical protein
VLALPYSTYDLCQHLDGQPLQIMVKDLCQTNGDSYMVSLLAWHLGLVKGLASTRNNTHVRHRHSSAPEIPLSPLRSPTPSQQQLTQQQQQQQQGRRVSGSGSGSGSGATPTAAAAGGGPGGSSSRSGQLNGGSSSGHNQDNGSSSGGRAVQEGWSDGQHHLLHHHHQQQQRASYHGPSNLGSSQRHLQPAASSPVPEMGGFEGNQVEAGSYSSSGGGPSRSHLQQHLQASLEVAPRSHSASASVTSPSYARQGGDSQGGRARGGGSSAFDRVAAAAAGASPSTSIGGAVAGGSSGGSPLSGQSPRHGPFVMNNSAVAAAAALFSSGGSPAAAARKRRPSGEERAGGLGVGEGSNSLSGMGSLPPIPAADE